MKTLKLRVYGQPIPQGSVKPVPRGDGGWRVVNNSKKVTPWRRTIVKAYQAEGAGWKVPEGTAVDVSVVFWIQRPGYHHKAHGRSPHLRDDAPPVPVAADRSDVDKLSRAVLDGLADAKVYPNDAQVCGLYARKLYATAEQPPGVLILVNPTPISAAGVLPLVEADYA